MKRIFILTGILIIISISLLIGGLIFYFQKEIKELLKIPEVKEEIPKQEIIEKETIKEEIPEKKIEVEVEDLEDLIKKSTNKNDEGETISEEKIFITPDNFPKEGKDILKDIILPFLNQFPDNPEIILEKMFIAPSGYEKYSLQGEERLITWAKKADLNGDGKKEIIISFAINPHYFGLIGYPGGLAILSKDKDNKWKIDYSYSRLDTRPKFYFIRDVNKNNRPDLAFTTRWFGACAFGMIIYLIEWNREGYQNIGDINLHSVEKQEDFKFEDLDKDGKEEIILYGGIIGCAGAGHQRNRTWIFSYQEEKNSYQLVEEFGDLVDDIYFLIVDSHITLKKNDFQKALELALKSLKNPDWTPFYYYYDNKEVLKTFKFRILSYAGIEAILSYLRKIPPDLDSAKLILKEIEEKYHQKDNPYIKGAQILFNNYLKTKDIIESCKKMEEEILKNCKDIKFCPEVDFFDWYGYNTERIDLEELCPWP